MDKATFEDFCKSMTGVPGKYLSDRSDFMSPEEVAEWILRLHKETSIYDSEEDLRYMVLTTAIQASAASYWRDPNLIALQEVPWIAAESFEECVELNLAFVREILPCSYNYAGPIEYQRGSRRRKALEAICELGAITISGQEPTPWSNFDRSTLTFITKLPASMVRVNVIPLKDRLFVRILSGELCTQDPRKKRCVECAAGVSACKLNVHPDMDYPCEMQGVESVVLLAEPREQVMWVYPKFFDEDVRSGSHCLVSVRLEGPKRTVRDPPVEMVEESAIRWLKAMGEMVSKDKIIADSDANELAFDDFEEESIL
jgi:hypothetical protein